MRCFVFPPESKWGEIFVRPSVEQENDLSEKVDAIIDSVKQRGDSALAAFAKEFDGVAPPAWRYSLEERDLQANKVSPELAAAIDKAIETIETFHKSQISIEPRVETAVGVSCWRRPVPLSRVGLYVPAGTAPLVSTLLMLAIPAQVAKVPDLVVTTPVGLAGMSPAIAYALRALGLEEIYTVGGAQAIAALAFGTQSIPKVDKICGPGNRFVTEAKVQVAARGVAIDMPAGPSEVLVIADEGANPAFVAADLLAQAEHGSESQVVLICLSKAFASKVQEEIQLQLKTLGRHELACGALEGSILVVADSVGKAIQMSNLYAPEHLILAVEDAERYALEIVNAGSVFLGYWTGETFGDYASGTNHVLPTGGAARVSSGISVDSFVKKITFQTITEEGVQALGPTVVELAKAEGLDAHARAVSIRMEML